MPIEREHCVKGGQNVPPEKRGFSVNRKLAAEAGRKGGLISQQTLAKKCNNCFDTHRKCRALLREFNRYCCMHCTHEEIKK